MTDMYLTAAATTSVDPRRRRITGLVVPWDETGNTDAGPTRFARGSIRPGARSVKLLVQHDDTRPAVGRLTDAHETPAGLMASFEIPAGPEGDEALRLAASGQRDGLSVGVAVTEYDLDAHGVIGVTAGELFEVSLVTIPAFASATVLDIAANRKGNTIMTDPTPAPEPTPNPAPEPAPTPEPAPEPVDVHAAAGRSTVIVQAGAITPPTVTNPRPMDIRAAAVAALAHLRSGAPLGMLRAALADLVPADDLGQGFGPTRPAWVGELWTASKAARPFIDSIRRGALESLTVTGFVIDPEFVVAPYAGSKAAIPSSKVGTRPVTTTAKRWAGGLDIDRVFIDLGTPGLIADLFQQGTDSYRVQTEAEAVTAGLAASTDIPAAASVPAFLSAAGIAAMTIGATIDFLLVSPDVWSDFAGLTGAEVPWWLNNGDGGVNLATGAGNAGGLRFAVDTELPANTLLAGDSRAATWYEVSPPIQARAENIPNGGIDIGVFGYGAILVNDPRALFNSSIVVDPPVTARSSK
jgi:HK97 family phage prohead protease